MSLTLTLSGNTSNLTAEYFPPLYLNQDYVCGLIDFQTYNSIPNVDERNNLLHIGSHVIEIPTGSYEIDDIQTFIKSKLERKKLPISMKIKANNNTLKCEVRSTEALHFEKELSIGKLLGFSKRVLEADLLHISDLPVDINKVNVIRVECNIITGSYLNNIPVHTIHEFSPEAGPGYKIIEVPRNVI